MKATAKSGESHWFKVGSKWHTHIILKLKFALFSFLHRAWQGDEIASIHLSNIVGKLITLKLKQLLIVLF